MLTVKFMTLAENHRVRTSILNWWLFLCVMGNATPAWGYSGGGTPSETCKANEEADSSARAVKYSNPAILDGELNNIVLFDGVCNFCNKWVDIMLQLDTTKKIRFCALQSVKGKDISSRIGRRNDELTSVILIKSIDKSEIYVKSDAILKVTEQFGFFWYLFSNLNLALPLFVRNGIYDIIAKNRYSILGKRDKCRCADGSYSDRFI